MTADRDPVLEALTVACELTGTQVSPAALAVWARDLDAYPLAWVLPALDRCRREVRGRITPADVLTRLADGRPGPEEAWAQIPRDEDATVIWSAEMRAAWAVALPLIESGDEVAARMAFLERYRRDLTAARDAALPVDWQVSPGRDPSHRETAIIEAVRLGRLSVQRAVLCLPNPDAVAELRTPAELAALPPGGVYSALLEDARS